MKLPLSNLSAPWEAIMIESNENPKIFYINISCHFEPSNICIMEIDVEYHDDMNNLSTSRDWTKLDDNLMSLIKADWIESIRYFAVSNEKNMKVTRSNANQIEWKSCSMKKPWKFRWNNMLSINFRQKISFFLLNLSLDSPSNRRHLLFRHWKGLFW